MPHATRRPLRAPLAALPLEDRLAPALFSAAAVQSFPGQLNNNGSAAVGLFNADAYPDLVLTNFGDGNTNGQKLTVLLGTAGGTFGSASQLTVGTNISPSFVTVADLNSDGKLDLVTAGTDVTSSTRAGYVTTFFGNGVGGFTPGATASSGGSNAFWVGVAQVTGGDTNPDVVVANGGTTDSGQTTVLGNNFAVFQGSATGALSSINTVSNGLSFVPTSGALADFDADGKVDAVFTVPGVPEDSGQPQPTGSLLYFAGNGAGGFTAGGAPSSGGALPINTQAADLNADGKLDLVVANAGDASNPSTFGSNTSVAVLLNTGGGTFAAPTVLTAGLNSGGSTAAFATAVADFNQDGSPDIAAVTYGDFIGFTPARIAVYLGSPTGSFTPDANSPYTPATALTGGQYVVAGDFDANGSQDLVAVGASNRVARLVNTSTPAAATATALTSSANPSSAGASVTFTATVTAGGPPVAAGTVQFFDGTTPLGAAVAVNASGQATYATAVLAAGPHTITAKYLGASGFAVSTSPAVTQVVNTVPAAATTTTVTSSGSPTAYNTPVTFTATVTSTGTPTVGTVTFRDGATPISGAVALDAAGKATFTTALLGAGAHSVTAVYGGGTGFAGSTSAAVAQTVTPAATTTALTASPTTVGAGAAVTLTATVTSAGGAPDGTVTFFDGATPIGSATVSGGVATFTTTTLATGSHTVTAAYSGAANFAASTSAAAAVIVAVPTTTPGPVATTTTLTASPTSVQVLGGITLTAVVASAGGTPTGTVTFYGDGVLIDTVALAAGPGGQTASRFITAFSPGTKTFTAVYAPNPPGPFFASTSNTATATVTGSAPVTPSVALLSSSNPGTAGAPLTFTAYFTTTGAPTAGTVTFFDGSAPLGQAAIANGTAAFTTAALAAGAHAVTARYDGGTGFNPATSAVLVEQVNKGTPAVTVAADAPTAAGATTLRATVARPSGVTVDPAGAVTFRVNGTVVGTAALSGGAATLSTTLPAGTSNVTAEFGGDNTFNTASATASATVPASPVSPPPPPPATTPGKGPLLTGYREFGVGAGAGRASDARFFNPDATERYSVSAFGGTGGVRTTSADFNGDGVADLVVGTGPGSVTQVRVLDGKTQAVLFTVQPFEDRFQAGVFVAAGDITGDGVPDLVITPDEGGGPRVRIFSGAGFGQVADFFGIDDPNFRGGARAGVGDIDGDGVGDLLVAAGFGGGPRVAGFSGKSLGNGALNQKLFADFFAFEEGLRNGAYVAAGDVDGDGRAEVIAGGGPGGGPRVTAFSGAGVLAGRQAQVANFFAGDPDNRGGVRVAVKDLDGDALGDLVVGSGTGAGSRVTGYLGKTVTAPTPPQAFAFDAFPGFDGGVYVG